MYRYFYLSILLTTLFSCAKPLEIAEAPAPPIILEPERAAELAKEIRAEVSAQLADGLELTLWASDSLAPDPVALFMDEQGRAFVTRTNRIEHSEFDIRGYRDWMTESISWSTVEDRRAFLRKTLSPENSAQSEFMEDLNQDSIRDWKDLTVEKEQVYLLEDRSGDGVADFSQLILEDFNEEVTDLAMAFVKHEKDYFLGVAPDLWRLKDHNEDGIIDSKESISHGYQVHIGFGAHGMSGLKVGPDGKIYWGIGDIGMNVVDKSGKRWFYPNRGVIVRSNPDGSDFEVYCHGVRNTHEFMFDKYGNLISVDNDGDHPGEQERIVYLINGSDTGWRINWQFGKYTDPDNNKYKVWMDESLYKPRFEGQAAYHLPPILNYHAGPTGMVYNPGTALSDYWKEKFFVVEFPGSAARARINAFTLKPKGAGFEFGEEEVVASGVLFSGLDVGPDGALYGADWITGWGAKDRGRIWKLDDPANANSAKRKEVKTLMAANFKEKENTALAALLKHEDMRIRQKAQFELANRNAEKQFLEAIEQKEHQLARVHGIWGLSQLARKDAKAAKGLIPLLTDQDAEIRAQAAKLLGDIRYANAADALLPLLKDESLRTQMMATEALGRLAYKPAIEGIIDMLKRNDDVDTYLRHAGAIALARIGEAEPLVALHNSDSKALRIAAVVALRRMQEPGIRKFLNDEDEFVVTEVARAINDDYSIEEALPDLARSLKEERFSEEALIRRAINANLRVGKTENLQIVAAFANRATANSEMRAEAIATLGVWHKPSVLDRVDGRLRGAVERDLAEVQKVANTVVADLLKAQDPTITVAAVDMVGRLQLQSASDQLFTMMKPKTPTEVRIATLKALYKLNDARTEEAIQIALDQKDKALRQSAIEMIPEMEISEERAVALFTSLLDKGLLEEKQTALEALAKLKPESTNSTFDKLLGELSAGTLNPGIHLDLMEAVKATKAPALLAKLENYEKTKGEDLLDQYRETLVGGDMEKGRSVLVNHEAAQCLRCHAIGDYGGNVGPPLNKIGVQYTRNEILESLIKPSARIAPGYGSITLTLKDGSSLTGVLAEETQSKIVLKLDDKEQIINKSEVSKRENAPSAMAPMHLILNKRELRDLIEFLANLNFEGYGEDQHGES